MYCIVLKYLFSFAEHYNDNFNFLKIKKTNNVNKFREHKSPNAKRRS